MFWSKKKIILHLKAAELLCLIKDETFVLKRITQYKMRNEIAKPIVAFRENTASVHYYPKVSTNKQLKRNSLILLDIWARVDQRSAPYADITWMAWYGGKIPIETQKVFKTVILARDKALNFIKIYHHRQSQILTGKAIDLIAREHINRSYKEKFLHGTGHELGFYSPHGRGRPINPRNGNPIKKNLAYTIEPGIYINGKFGVRSEIDFFLDERKVVVTTDIQRKLTLI
jgi:Xaa-Pro aminopeptidase